MKVLKIKVWVSTGYVGSKREDEIEIYIDDNATEEEIESAKENTAREWMFEEIEWGWGDLDKD
jgi:hypothetical protein